MSREEAERILIYSYMKHLNGYHLFESLDDLKEDISDILLELRDIGFSISYKWGNYTFINITKRNKDVGGFQFIKYIEIEDCIERLRYFLEKNQYNCVVRFRGSDILKYTCFGTNSYHSMDFMIKRGFTDIESIEFKIEIYKKYF